MLVMSKEFDILKGGSPMDPVTQGAFTLENFLLILFGLYLLGTIALDIGMVVSLVRQGDERRQLIVWKAGAFTLLITVLTQVFDVVEAVVRAQKLQSNPFIDLSVTALTYFVVLLVLKKRYGDFERGK